MIDNFVNAISENIMLQLSVILFIVLAVSLIMRLLKQPLIIGYIIAGVLIGPVFLNILTYDETLATFSELGIAFLLFIVGLHLSPKVIKEVGLIALITGIGQVVITTLIGYFFGLLMGFNSITSLYIAVAISFSSTIIITKLLSDKDALDKLYGKISIGFLLVQDFIAIIILLIVSSLSNSGYAAGFITSTFTKSIILIAILSPISYFILPKLNNFFSKSQEFLFVFAISWGLGLASLFYYIGFSLEVGALIAGILLSMSSYSWEVSAKLRSLRDFFLISFFILLGTQMSFSSVSTQIKPIILYSLLILIGNPIIVMGLMGFFRYTKSTGFMAGLTVAQISEFSLILIALGAKVGHLSTDVLSLITAIGLITIAGSSYMIIYSEPLYRNLSPLLRIFERKITKEKQIKEKEYQYFLLGENRIGFSIMKSFAKLKKNYVVVDYDPERIKRLKSRGIDCLYGDVSDADFLEEIKLDHARVIVSTIPESEINLIIINKIRKKNQKAIIILTARQISDAFELYDAGADYVILPHFLGGDYTTKIIEKSGEDKSQYKEEKKKHLRELWDRMQEGHEHPKTEKNKK